MDRLLQGQHQTRTQSRVDDNESTRRHQPFIIRIRFMGRHRPFGRFLDSTDFLIDLDLGMSLHYPHKFVKYAQPGAQEMSMVFVLHQPAKISFFAGLPVEDSG